jgi:hypothetical protein
MKVTSPKRSSYEFSFILPCLGVYHECERPEVENGLTTESTD